ncbi:MAG: Mrp/NBP35 family ATP-binding protein [Pirellulaceae bacterium]|nr:Mrp/NBP35 family ATP-binding protein [Planctomycetales bacterium]
MSTMDRQQVLEVMKELPDPLSGRNVVQMDQVSDVVCDDKSIKLTLSLTSHSALLADETKQAAIELLRCKFPSVSDVEVTMGIQQRPVSPLGQIGLMARSVIAVGSGKGGVGKSTVAASLAYGLMNAGSKVGIVDADVYGPSIPHLLGVSGRPEIRDNKIQPADADGLLVMSMGLLVEPGEAVVWRGPMLHGAITQMLRDTNWGQLDYLVIDMPPGTGDIALSLSQILPLTGAVVVCTPQDVALLDAVKAISMFRKVQIPLLGMVENMSGFLCPDCGKQHDIFGSGGAKARAEQLDVPFLGQVPINMQIRERGDAGQMSSLVKDSAAAEIIRKLCYQLVRNLADANAAQPPLPSLSVL